MPNTDDNSSKARDFDFLRKRYGPFVLIAVAFALVITIIPTPASGVKISGPSVADFSHSKYINLNCARQQDLHSPFYECPPTKWAGTTWTSANNGGSTDPQNPQGVTGNSISVVAYSSPENAVVDTILGQKNDLIGSIPQEQHVMEVYNKFFNQHFQTYGRNVHVSFYESSCNFANISTISRSDAVTIQQQYHPLATIGGIYQDYLDQAAAEHIFNIADLQLPESFLKAHMPYDYGLLPTTDYQDSMLAKFIINQLGPGSKATFAGSNSTPPVKGKPRKYGIIYPATNPDGTASFYNQTAQDLSDKLGTAGIKVVKSVGYTLDPSSLITQAKTDDSILQNAGVTSVICLCDPVSPVFFTRDAADNGWFPEWLQSGYQLQDYYQIARLYNQKEWANDFGISSIPMQAPLNEQPFYQAYRAIDPTGPNPPGDAQITFFEYLVLFRAIELAGPTLNPSTFANAMAQINLPSSSPEVPTYYFVNGKDYGGVQDAMITWWDPNATGPDGDQGTYVTYDGGYRFNLSDWPSSKIPLFSNKCTAPGSCGAPTYPSSTSPPGSLNADGSASLSLSSTTSTSTTSTTMFPGSSGTSSIFPGGPPTTANPSGTGSQGFPGTVDQSTTTTVAPSETGVLPGSTSGSQSSSGSGGSMPSMPGMP